MFAKHLPLSAGKPRVLAFDERVATVIDPAASQPALLAFSSLVKAVAFMQAAILAKWIGGVNKVGKFRGEAARTWALPFLLNPKFDDLRSAALGPAYQVDLETAILGKEKSYMNEEESTVPAEWYAISARDLGACKTLLGDKDVFLLQSRAGTPPASSAPS